MKKTWEGINNLLNRKKVNTKQIDSIQNPKNENKITRDASLISNILNEHFATVGPKLANQLPQSEKHFSDFLSKSKSPFNFQPILASEVKLEILSILNDKSHGLYSSPTKLLKLASDKIDNVLAEIFNKSIVAGEYPEKLKLAKIIPIFK